MEKRSEIPEDEKWQAVAICDANYDGRFCYGVRTTRIFCRPSCRSRTPVRRNVVYFADAAEALAADYRPCKRCRPDQAVFAPDRELVQKAKAILDTDYDKTVDLTEISRQLGVSPNHLARLFKSHMNLTPAQYITRLRIDKAAELLSGSGISILETAHATGFKSISSFYRHFKEQTGQPPNEYRKNRGRP